MADGLAIAVRPPQSASSPRDTRGPSETAGSCADASPQNSDNSGFRDVGPHRKLTDKAAQSGIRRHTC
jgi:hypothetical protein